MLRSKINNLLLPNLVLPLVDRFSDNKAWSHLKAFERADQEDPETRRERQWARTRSALEHAYHHTLFYRERMDRVGLTPDRIHTPADLRRLPVTTQEDLRSNFPDGVLAADADLERVRISSTSGTFPPPLVPNFLETGLERYLQQLRQRRPQVLVGNPIYLYLLARLVERRGGGARVRGVRAVDSTGDLSTAELRAYLSRQFGAPVFQVYGGCEWGRLAGACADGGGGLMHLVDDLAYVEFITPAGEPAAPGELGNIIVTSLTNRTMPLIRYEQGDVGHYTDEPCPCGRTSRRADMEGRIHGLIIRGGRVIPTSAVMERLLPGRGILLFQLEQLDDDAFELTYLPDPEMPPDGEALRDSMAGLLGPGASVTTRVSDIFKTAPSGKYRLVISKSFESFRCA